MRKRQTKVIEDLQRRGIPVVEFDVSDMKKLKTWHPADNQYRQEQLRKEILDGSENTPIIITKDHVVLDGHGRLRAYSELGIPIKALVLPVALDDLQYDFLDIVNATDFNRFMANDDTIDDFLDL